MSGAARSGKRNPLGRVVRTRERGAEPRRPSGGAMSQRMLRRVGAVSAVTLSTIALTLPAASAADGPGPAAPTRYTQRNLVADEPGMAALVDPNLKNAWGMAQSPTSPIWVANNHSNTATIYTGDGVMAPPSIVPLVVGVPGDGPTGQVFNGTSGFVVS